MNASLNAASHIFWDGFTHGSGYFVTTFSVISGNIQLGTAQVEVYRVLQHISTLVGGIVIVVSILSLPRRQTSDPIVDSGKYWTVVICITVVTIAIGLLSAPTVPSPVSIIVIVISSTMVALILAPLVVRWWR